MDYKNMHLNRLIFSSCVVLFFAGCRTHNLPHVECLSTQEVVHMVDSLSEAYRVDAKLNLSYLKSHPIPRSEERKLRMRIITASPVFNPDGNISEDSIGSFRALPVSRSEEQKLQDFWAVTNEFSHSYPNNKNITDTLSERYGFCYELTFSDLHKNAIKLVSESAKVVDFVTNDSVAVKLKDMRYAQLSKVPLIYAVAFKFDFDGTTYVEHLLFDARTVYNEQRKPNLTRGFYPLSHDWQSKLR